MARRYTEKQLARALRGAHAKDWGDLLGYLEARPDASGLEHDRLAEMEDDVAKLEDRGEPFRADAAAVYRAVEASQPSRVVPGGTARDAP
jgi:hypothetical protein